MGGGGCYFATQGNNKVTNLVECMFEQMPWLCRKLSTLNNHHHNQVFITQLFTPTCQRGQYLQQRLSFLLLYTALTHKDLSDEEIHNFQVCRVFFMCLFRCVLSLVYDSVCMHPVWWITYFRIFFVLIWLKQGSSISEDVVWGCIFDYLKVSIFGKSQVFVTFWICFAHSLPVF